MSRSVLASVIIAAIGICLSVVPPAGAHKRGISVRPAGHELIEAEPPYIVTTLFRVTNKTRETREFEGQVKLPPQWKLITTQFPFKLGADQSDMRLVSFLVPTKSAPGRYQVTYLVSDRLIPSISDLYSVTVVVLPVTRLEVKLLEAPDFAIAGEEYQVSFLVMNRGNAKVVIDLRTESENDYPAVPEVRVFSLEPGNSRNVTVTVKTDPELRHKKKHLLKLIARVKGPKTKEVEARAGSRVEILPRQTGRMDPYHKIPMRFTQRGLIEGDENETRLRFQTEISGRGTLDEEREKRVDFMFRGPDTREDSILGRRDEYRFNFSTDRYDLSLGDRVFLLSPLTEFNAFRRGAMAKVKLSGFTVGGYYAESRFFQPDEEQAAAYVNYQISEKYNLGINFLNKRGSVSTFSTMAGQDILSVRALLQPVEDINIDLEYGRGVSGETNAGDDDAYHLRLSGHRGEYSYQLRHIRAGAEFLGNYSNTDFWSGSLIVPLLYRLRLLFDYRREEDNLKLDPFLNIAPLNEDYRLGFRYRFRPSNSFFLNFRYRNRQDRLPLPSFDQNAKSVSLSVVQGFKKLHFSLTGELERELDKLTRQTSIMQEYRLSASFSPTDNQSYRGHIQYNQDVESAERKRRSITAGLSSSLKIGERTFVNLEARTTSHKTITSGGREIFQVRLNRLFRNNHNVSMTGRYTIDRSSTRAEEVSTVIEYTVPFGLPVSRKKSIGVMKGYIYNAETGIRIPNVIIRLNEVVAVSDGSGDFVFPALPPGKYHLRVDASNIGLDRTTTQATPRTVTIEGGKEARLAIGVTRGARLMGRVMVYPPREEGELFVEGTGKTLKPKVGEEEPKELAPYGLANIIVEMVSESERQRRVTDTKGRFVFAGLRPGKWTLKLLDTNLPEYHYFENNTLEMQFEPGERREIEAKVLPQKRPIKIIEEGEVLEEN